MSWRVAESLGVLLAEINAAAPHRSTDSDGSIGDEAHATRDSDHNPWVIDGNGVGVVRARDFTHDPAGGLDCNELALALAALIAVGGHPACRSGAYVIWNRRIMSFDRRGEGWRPYTGSNPHDHHCHMSVATAAAGYDSTRPWGVMDERDEIDMATKQDLREIVADVVDRKLAPVLRQLKRMREVMKARHERVLHELDDLAADQDADADTIRTRLRGVRQELAGIRAEFEQIEADDQ